MTKSHISTLNSAAFSNTVSFLASCNPGTSYGTSFAQAWANKTGGTTYAFVGKSDYTYINSGSNNLLSKWQHFWGSFYNGGSYNYPIAGTTLTAAGESPYLHTFRPVQRGGGW
jgi:hypothetical protein